MIRATPATQPITPPAIVAGGVVTFGAAADAAAADVAAAFEVVDLGHSLNVEVSLVLVRALELEVAWARFRVKVVGDAVVVNVVSEKEAGRNPKAIEKA